MVKSILMVIPCALCGGVLAAGEMEKNFLNPPDFARPGVYWYFMNGNLHGKEMTADLESMMKHMSENFTPEEWKYYQHNGSNAGYHYFGCAKTFALMGKAFAEVMVNLQNQVRERQ